MKLFLPNTPKLLWSYLATEMLAPFFASFIIMNSVFFLVKLIPFLNFVLELNIGFADFVRLFSYLFPNIFLYSIPMSAMMGVTIGFARLSSDSEILALKAGGISMYRILPPVLLVASLIAILTAYFSTQLIPRSEIAMKQLTYQLLKEKISHGIKEHVFTEALGDVVVYVEAIDKKSGEWKNVWVSDMRGVETPTITMASTGHMESSIKDMMVSIILRSGSLHRPSRSNAEVVQFDRYLINIPMQPPSSKRTRLKKRSSLTMSGLLEESSNRTVNTLERRKYLIEFHRRLVLPVGCLMISLLGLPLGLQARPGKKAIGIQAGLAFFVLYYILFTVGKTLAEESVLPVPVAMWGPNTLFFLLALFWIIRIGKEQPLLPIFITDFTWFIRLETVNFAKRVVNRIRGRQPGDQTTDPETDDGIFRPTKPLIRGNAKSRVFHVPSCEYYTCRNCTIEFKNVQIALDSGFEPCRFCQDLIEEFNKNET